MIVDLHESTLRKIFQFLSTPQRIVLARTCKHLYDMSLTEMFWSKLCINDRDDYYENFLEWCFVHIDSISPTTMELTLFNCTSDKLNRIVQFFSKGIKSLRELSLWVMGLEYHQQFLLLHTILVNHPQLTTLSSTIFVQDREITGKMAALQRLYIVGQDICFSGVCLERLPNLQALVIKPHELDFGELTKYIERSGKGLDELEIDCENYPPELFIRMMGVLNPSVLTKLRLYHLENLNGQCFANLARVANLQELIITKAYQISNDVYSLVFGKTHWPYLTRLDISESIYIEDSPLIELVKKSPSLRSIKLAWCTKLSSHMVGYIVEHCLSIEQLVVTGVKLLNDNAFKDYQKLLPHFSKDKYYELRQGLKKQTKILPSDITQLFGGKVDQLEGVRTLRQLRLLDCVSCDDVSTELLEVVGVLSPLAVVLDYYSNRVGLHLIDPLFD